MTARTEHDPLYTGRSRRRHGHELVALNNLRRTRGLYVKYKLRVVRAVLLDRIAVKWRGGYYDDHTIGYLVIQHLGHLSIIILYCAYSYASLHQLFNHLQKCFKLLRLILLAP